MTNYWTSALEHWHPACRLPGFFRDRVWEPLSCPNLRNDVADIETAFSQALGGAPHLLKGTSFSDFSLTLGSASEARQVERLTVLSPSSGSAYQWIPLPGAHCFDKDISKATVKIKVLHNPQHPPLTSEILLHVSFYCYFTKALTERQRSQKEKKKKSAAGSKGEDDRLFADCTFPFPKAARGTEIWVSFLLN